MNKNLQVHTSFFVLSIQCLSHSLSFIYSDLRRGSKTIIKDIKKINKINSKLNYCIYKIYNNSLNETAYKDVFVLL
jgi:hypothetical protein